MHSAGNETTLLIHASEMIQLKHVKLLLEYGADPNKKLKSADPEFDHESTTLITMFQCIEEGSSSEEDL